MSTDPLACGDTAKIQQFAAWAASVAQTFPTVHQFVVMNECNQPLFVNPQWNAGGQNQSAQVCGRALAAAYDAIKGVSSANFVWGVGLSPRGNDNARAVTNSSTSPVKFLGYLGTWFKAFAKKTHRTAPLMDGFDFHPYPVPQSLAFDKGYPNPNDAAVSNLTRIYQAFYDAFQGSPQKTIGQQRGGGLPVSLNEVGIQTAPNGPAYSGIEVSATAGGVRGAFASADFQAQWYYKMLELVSCDPNIRLVNIFHLVDEPILSGWQSGLFYADQTPKQSADMIHSWIASSGGRCQGKTFRWKPAPASHDHQEVARSSRPQQVRMRRSAKATQRNRGLPRMRFPAAARTLVAPLPRQGKEQLMTLAPTSPRFQRTPEAKLFSTPVAESAAHKTAILEERRWVAFLVVPFILGSAFFAATIVTGNDLWMAGTVILGVMGLIFSFLFLSISSNSN